jgi:hypothetical protein
MRLISALAFLLIVTDSSFGLTTHDISIVERRKVVHHSSGTQMEFLRVLEDSRCPVNVECITGGVARIMLKVKPKGGKARTVELAIGDIKTFATVGRYKIELLDLKPLPGEPRKLSIVGKTAVLSIERAK